MSTNSAYAPPYRRYAPLTADAPATGGPSACECARTFNLQCEQGATLSSQITIKLNDAPVDITGGEFQFTAKLDPTLPDTDPGTIMIDWTESTTPTLGTTWLVIPAETTVAMQTTGAYSYQVRFVSSGNVVTPICHGLLTITAPPASSRF